MTLKIAFLEGDVYDKLDDESEAMFAALQKQGIEAVRRPWAGDTAPFREFDAVLLQSYSGYHLNIEAYNALLKSFAADPATTLLNPPETAHWNGDKTYLRDLEQAGHAVIPTVWSDQASDTPLANIMDDQSWNEIVVKPTISAGAYETKRLKRAEAELQQDWYAACCQQHTMMIQPYAPEIVEEGEWSLHFFNNRYSHTVLKWPGKGDYRVQHVHGGGYEHREPPEAMLNAALAVLPSIPGNTLYARVDGIWRDNQLLIMEIELIEPFLYLLPNQEAVKNFAAAVAERLSYASKAA